MKCLPLLQIRNQKKKRKKMETTHDTFWVLEVSLQDCLKATDIINDLPRQHRAEMEWVASDTATIWSEELVEEIEFRLEAQGIEFELKTL